MWMMIKEGGWGAMLALGLGSLGIILGIVSLALLPIARKVGHAMGIVTLVFALLASMVGILGMASGRRMTDGAISGESVGPGMKIRIRHQGYLESAQSAKIGFGMGALPLVLGATAAFVGARRKREDPPSNARFILAGVASLIALLTCGGALAASLGPIPPDMSYEDSRLLDARAAVDDDITDGCHQLEEAMAPFWHPADKKEWPRHFQPDPRKIVPDFDAVANRCMESWTGRDTDLLLASPLLVDEDRKKTIESRTPSSNLGNDPFAGGWGRDTSIGDAFADLGQLADAGPLLPGRDTMRTPHPTKSPSVRMGSTTVAGRLPPEVIQRIVRQNFGRFRVCYEDGLKKNPSLEGSVTVRFVIGRDGTVSTVSDNGSTLPDASVVACVVKAFYNLSFPQPEGGIVTVTYPIHFAPGS